MMDFRSGRIKRRVVTTIDITSLVDVVFLLLIFLLVTTTFKRQEHAFAIELPTSGLKQVTVTADKTTIFITKEGDMHLLTVPIDMPDSELTVGEAKPVSRENLIEMLEALHERRPHTPISIRGEHEATYQQMIDLVSIVQGAGFRNIWFPYALDSPP